MCYMGPFRKDFLQQKKRTIKEIIKKKFQWLKPRVFRTLTYTHCDGFMEMY